MQFVMVAVGAMLGADLRFLIGNWAVERWGTDFPYGTLIVNVSGAFAIGVVLAFLNQRLDMTLLWRLFFVTGFLGGYTTFSTYAWETVTLADEGAWLRAAAYVLASNVIGFLGVWFGTTLGRLVPS